MKLKILFVFVITNLMFVSSIFSQQLEWETQINMDLNVRYDGEYSFFYDVIYDEYGFNIAGIDFTNGNRKIHYFLFGNDGAILEQIQNLGNETELDGVCIGSNKGKVYIVTRKNRVLKFYEKANGIGSFSLKHTQTLNSYTSFEDVTWMKMAFLNDNLYVTFNTYSWGNEVGLVKYDPITHDVTELPVVGYGKYPDIISYNGKIYIAYWGGNNFFESRTFDGVNYTNPKDVGDFGNPPLGNYTSEFRPSLVAGKGPDNNDYLYLSAILNWRVGSGPIHNDMKFKYKRIEDSYEWPAFNETENTIAYDNWSRFINPGIVFNSQTSKVGFLYTFFSSGILGSFREHIIGGNPALGDPQTIAVIPLQNAFLEGGSLSRGLKGNFAIFCNGAPQIGGFHTKFSIIRQPEYITGNITYNTLLTGNEYISKTGLPDAHANGAEIIALNNSRTEVISNTNFYIDGGGSLTLNSGALLEVGDNCNIIVDGNNSFIKFNPGSTIKMGANSKIEVKNNGYLEADDITFEGNNGATWEGLVFHNAGGQTKIENCTLKNAKISIDIINTTGCYANLEKKFINNVFDQISTSTHIIKAENVFKVLMQGNTFNIASGKTGVEISNSINTSNSQEEGGESSGGSLCLSTTYALNILGNTFNNGLRQLLMDCYASAVTPFWVHGNYFNSTGSTGVSLFGRKITGDIKTNTFTSNNLGNNVILVQSSVNVFNNEMNASTRNFVLAT